MTTMTHAQRSRSIPAIGGRGTTATIWLIWAMLLILGGIGVYQRIAHGHLPAGYGSYVPWGLWVALYFHGVGIAGGAFVVGAGGFILGLPGFRSRKVLRTVIVLSVAAMIPALMAVWFDLGHMNRSHRILTTPAFTSMMAFNAWMYVIFMISAAVALVLSYCANSGWLKPVLCLALMFAVLFPSQSGAFFGVVDAKAYWHSALLPLMFLTSAITAGAATLLFARMLTRTDVSDAEHLAGIRTLRTITLCGLCVYFVFEFAEFSVALWNPVSHAPAIELVLWGPYWWVFWMVHLAVGGVLALILLATSRPMLWALAAVIVAIAFVSARLNVLVPGQAVGEIKGLQEAFHHDRLSYIYHATLMEYLVGLFLVAVGMAVFFVGRQITRKLESTPVATHRGDA
jgi:molybdopterin-containing oxidoreductase family membrane subunit